MFWPRFHRNGGLSSWWHYVLPPESRQPGIGRLVEEGRDLVVTGPRGVGKTALFLSLAQELRASGRHPALFVRCRSAWTDPDTALGELRRQIVGEGRKLPRDRRPSGRPVGPGSFRLRELLSAWSLRCAGQAVLFLDDLSEVGAAGRLAILREVLRCSARPEDIPLHLVAILGPPSIADDVRQIESEVTARAGAPLEERRKSRVVEVGRFQAPQVGGLYDLHTARTGQVFTQEAKDTSLHLAQGEPRRVNALADEALSQVPGQRSVEGNDIRAAYDRLWPPSCPSGTAPYPPPSQPLRPAFLLGALLVSLALAGLLLGPSLYWARSPEPDTSDLNVKELELKKIAGISEPESLEELCADLGTSPEKFDACREKLPVLSRTYIWIDTDSLVKPGETLGPEHLGMLYGVSRPKDEASRLALAAILAAECQQHRPPEKGAASFDEFFEERCRESLPSLAHLGLEIDPAWLAPEEAKTDTP